MGRFQDFHFKMAQIGLKSNKKQTNKKTIDCWEVVFC